MKQEEGQVKQPAVLRVVLVLLAVQSVIDCARTPRNLAFLQSMGVHASKNPGWLYLISISRIRGEPHEKISHRSIVASGSMQCRPFTNLRSLLNPTRVGRLIRNRER